VRRVLVTGMSGTGKSAALGELRKHGFDVVDTDEPGWTVWCSEDGGRIWREDRVAELLEREAAVPLYVSGTVSNQGRFYPRFDAVVLLSAPAEVLLRRLERRTSNDYGKSAEQRELVLRHLAEVEPLLRATCTHETIPLQPIDAVVAELVSTASRLGEARPRPTR
jgi:dephospho-CoA kinase